MIRSITLFVSLGVSFVSAPVLARGYFSDLRRPVVNNLQVDGDNGPVILIVVDALRPDHLQAYGYTRETSPNLLQLANDGVVFSNYFVNGNWTRPSTASLVTGFLPTTHGVERDQDKLASQYITLAEILGQKKIPTGAVVGNGNAGSAFGLGRGFDYYADTVKHWQGLPSAEQVIQLAVPFVEKHRAEPFFLMLFFVDPHDPYHAPEPYENMFVKDPRVALIRSPHWELGRYTPHEVERMRATYDGAIRYTDTALGNFFSTLKQMGIYDRATIVITADHGEAFGEHKIFLHGHHLYDEIVRAPLIVRAPKMDQRGAAQESLLQTIDLFPTIAGMYRASVSRELPGMDIFAHLRKKDASTQHRIVISEFHNFGIRRRSVRTLRHKVIYEEPANEQEFSATVGKKSLLPSVSFDAERVQMFDLTVDPKEQTNLYTPQLALKAPWNRMLKIAKAIRKNQNGTVAHVSPELDPETYKDLKALGYIQ